jgi:hypothetical protein
LGEIRALFTSQEECTEFGSRSAPSEEVTKKEGFFWMRVYVLRKFKKLVSVAKWGKDNNTN